MGVALGIAAAGLAVGGIGAGLSASSASAQRKALRKQAKTPFLSGSTYAGEAVESAKASLPGLKDIGEAVNLFNQEQLLKMNRMAMPGYDSLQAKTSEQILSMLRGELPDDVARAVTKTAAGKALAGGFGGSGMARNLGLRDLGISSLQTMQAGITAFDRWMTTSAQTAVPAMFNPASFFLSPTSLYQGALQQRGQNMGVGAQAVMAPTGAATIGGFLGQVGGIAAGAGMQSYLGGRIGGSGTGDSGGPSMQSITMYNEMMRGAR
jgi:hypothetical protein